MDPDHAPSHIWSLDSDGDHQLVILLLQEIINRDDGLRWPDILARDIDLVIADLLDQVLERDLLEIIGQDGLWEQLNRKSSLQLLRLLLPRWPTYFSDDYL